MEKQRVKQYALILAVAGVLLAIGILIHPDETKEGALTHPFWFLAHLIIGIAFVLIVFGLRAFEIKQDKLNGFDKFSITLATLVTIIIVGLAFFVESFIVPALANSQYADVLSETGPLMGGVFGTVLFVILIIMALSFVLLGITVIVRKYANPLAGIFLFGVVPFVFAPPLPWILGIIGGVLAGIGISWIGVSIFRNVK